MTIQVLRVRASSASASGAPVVTGVATVGGLTVSGVKGGSTVTLTPTVTGTFTALTATVRTGSLAGITLSGTGSPSWTFVAPYHAGNPTDVMVDVVATYSGGVSDTFTFVVTVYPWTSWYANAAGTAWLPIKTEVNL